MDFLSLEFCDKYILSFLIFFPLAGAFLIGLLPKENKNLIKTLGLILFVLEFIFSLHLYFRHNVVGPIEFQFDQSMPWIPSWNANYYVAVDGLSVLLVILSTFIMPISLIGTWHSIEKNLKLYIISLLVLLTGMIGVFCALDLFLFYVFWEVMLVPMYLLIGIWGGKERFYASVKFFIYTMAGSLIMLVAILYLYFKTGQTFDITKLYDYQLTSNEQFWLFLAMALAFAIKVPLFPLHTWLPDAHVEAPTAGSVILAGVLLKMGVYGYLRIAIPFFPQAVIYLQWYLMAIAAFGVVYGALVAMVQPDIKKLIAYSSVSHMGIVMLGVFSLNQTAMTGGMYQMLNHAISTGGLFLLVGMVYDRTHTRLIKDYSGLAKLMPVFTVFFLIITFSSIAVPTTNGFVGEFLALLGSFQVDSVLTVIAALGVIFSAVYMLWLVQRVFFGAVKETPGANKDLKWMDVLALSPLVVLIFWMGIYPQPFLERLERPANTILIHVNSQDREMLVQRGEVLWKD